MPPKKNVEKPAKAPKKTPKRTPKKRMKKETPKFKIPTVIKFKFPPIKSLANRVSPAKMSPPTKTRPLSPQLTKTQKRKIEMAARSIELANAVALAQLVKPLAGAARSWEPEPPPPPPPPKAKPRKRPGRPRRSAGTDIPTDTEETVKAPKKNTPNKTTKDSKNIAINKIYVPNKRKAVSTSKQPVKKPKDSKPELVRPKKPKRNSTPIKRSSRQTAKTFLEGTAAAVESPSILDSKALANESPCFNTVQSAVSCRKASTASSECNSWTKDISSSSATTCITVQSPKEFVRFDNRMPVIKIPNLDYFKPPAVENGELSSSVSDKVGDTTECTSDSSSSSSHEDPASNSLKLSTSSVTPVKTPDGVDDKLLYKLEKLNSKLNMLDLESITWIGYDKSKMKEADKNIHSKMFRHLKEEQNILRQCKELKRIFADENAAFESPYNSDRAVTNYTEPIEAQITDKSEDDEFTSAKSRDVMLQCYSKNNSFTEDPNPDDEFTTDRVKFTSFEPQDDDDVLSISADSYMESSLFDVGSTPAIEPKETIEEYVPEPISTFRPPNKIVYNPTQIAEQPVEPLVVAKTVCEKQNADSTSINKEVEQSAVTNNDLEKDRTVSAGPTPQTSLIASQYKPVNAVKSAVFKGVCYFNLVSACTRKPRCMFPHKAIPMAELVNRLTRLTNQAFIEEYMLLRNWSPLRHVYGRCYVLECKNRQLTRVLVEMALDFNATPNDAALRLAVSEITLLHLNDVDLSECERLLKQPVGQKRLCDVFVSVLGETQNLSRFKCVFVKLTAFIAQNGGDFDPAVASHLLERVSILPYELSLARALLSVIENTHPAIFTHPSMVHFEKQLSKDSGLLKEFLAKKQLVLNEDMEPLNVEGERAMSDKERYTSPDTTKLEMLRPLDALPTPRAPPRFAPAFSGSSASSDGRAPCAKFRHWRPQGGYKRPATDYMNGAKPPKFIRKMGPDFYNL